MRTNRTVPRANRPKFLLSQHRSGGKNESEIITSYNNYAYGRLSKGLNVIYALSTPEEKGSSTPEILSQLAAAEKAGITNVFKSFFKWVLINS